MAVILLALALVASACSPDDGSGEGSEAGDGDAGESGSRAPEIVVLERRPHDTGAWTEGLVFHEGSLYESTGEYGRSVVREVDPVTGRALRQTELDDDLYGEGLALVGDRLIQLTWKEETALVYDLETFEVVDRFEYEGEGWGLCAEDGRLYMTNGSATVFVRDPETFEVLDEVTVTRDGDEVDQLNELECVDGSLYANVWQTDDIVVIDPDSGEITATIDGAGLLEDDERDRADVLNGIAHDPESGRFYLTGKLWPALFEVEID